MGQEISTQKAFFNDIETSLAGLLKQKIKALPKTLNEARFIQNTMSVLLSVKDIELCSIQSIADSILKGAYLDLDFITRECYIIAYNKNIGTKSNPKWVKEAKFQTSYIGERKLAYKYSLKPVKEVYAKIVREGDVLVLGVTEGKQTASFSPVVFSDKKIVGVFAIVYYEDDSITYEVMSLSELDNIKVNFSQAYEKSKAWKYTPTEMYRKVIMRRILKSVSLSFESHEQQMAFKDGADFDNKKSNEPIEVKAEVSDPFADDIQTIDATPQQIPIEHQTVTPQEQYITPPDQKVELPAPNQWRDEEQTTQQPVKQVEPQASSDEFISDAQKKKIIRNI